MKRIQLDFYLTEITEEQMQALIALKANELVIEDHMVTAKIHDCGNYDGSKCKNVVDF